MAADGRVGVQKFCRFIVSQHQNDRSCYSGHGLSLSSFAPRVLPGRVRLREPLDATSRFREYDSRIRSLVLTGPARVGTRLSWTAAHPARWQPFSVNRLLCYR